MAPFFYEEQFAIMKGEPYGTASILLAIAHPDTDRPRLINVLYLQTIAHLVHKAPPKQDAWGSTNVYGSALSYGSASILLAIAGLGGLMGKVA